MRHLIRLICLGVIAGLIPLVLIPTARPAGANVSPASVPCSEAMYLQDQADIRDDVFTEAVWKDAPWDGCLVFDVGITDYWGDQTLKSKVPYLMTRESPEERGERALVTLIAGLTTDGDAMYDMCRYLVDYYSDRVWMCVSPHLPGRGGSSLPESDWYGTTEMGDIEFKSGTEWDMNHDVLTLEALLPQLTGYADAAGPGDHVLGGWSRGGITVTALEQHLDVTDQSLGSLAGVDAVTWLAPVPIQQTYWETADSFDGTMETAWQFLFPDFVTNYHLSTDWITEFENLDNFRATWWRIQDGEYDSLPDTDDEDGDGNYNDTQTYDVMPDDAKTETFDTFDSWIASQDTIGLLTWDRIWGDEGRWNPQHCGTSGACYRAYDAVYFTEDHYIRDERDAEPDFQYLTGNDAQTCSPDGGTGDSTNMFNCWVVDGSHGSAVSIPMIGSHRLDAVYDHLLPRTWMTEVPESEDNGKCSSADTADITRSVNGTTSTGDDDYFKVKVLPGQNVTVTTERKHDVNTNPDADAPDWYSGPEVRLALQKYDRCGPLVRRVGKQVDATTTTATVPTANGTLATATQTATYTNTSTVEETWYLKVSYANSTAYDASDAYWVDVTSTTPGTFHETESNDTCSTADAAPSSVSGISGELASESDVDNFTLIVPTGHELEVRYTVTSTEYTVTQDGEEWTLGTYQVPDMDDLTMAMSPTSSSGCGSGEQSTSGVTRSEELSLGHTACPIEVWDPNEPDANGAVCTGIVTNSTVTLTYDNVSGSASKRAHLGATAYIPPEDTDFDGEYRLSVSI